MNTVKVKIFYEFTKNGGKQHAEVLTEAPSKDAAKREFERKFKGRFDQVVEVREAPPTPRP
jgi:hypothetical protein